MKKYEQEFRTYLQDNIDTWIKCTKLKGDIQDIIDFSSFLFKDSVGVKIRNEREINIYGMGLCEYINGFRKELKEQGLPIK